MSTPILLKPTEKPLVTWEAAAAWAASRGGNPLYVRLAPVYWTICKWRGNVRPEIAYPHMGKETNLGRFGGVLDATFCNPCGMKTTRGGGDYDKEAHTRFPDWVSGVIAHIDHLALYAGDVGYPKPGTTDPRHFASIKGVAPTVESLNGRWAPSKSYGDDLLKNFVNPLIWFATQNDPSVMSR